VKLKSLIVTCVLVLSTSAFAQWYPARVQMTVLPGQVAAQVFNPTYYPLICGGQVFGQTYVGSVFTTYFVEQYIVPGDFRYALVQTSPYLPFVTGWANINCRYAGF
jgi:hypothetical protein